MGFWVLIPLERLSSGHSQRFVFALPASVIHSQEIWHNRPRNIQNVCPCLIFEPDTFGIENNRFTNSATPSLISNTTWTFLNITLDPLNELIKKENSILIYKKPFTLTLRAFQILTKNEFQKRIWSHFITNLSK